ncbi:MAG: zinc ribbon domain-containing protein [Actinomycetota bacterium]
MPDYPDDTLLRLLDLQAEDTAIQRLTERRAALPESEELARTKDRLAEVESDIAIASKQDEALTSQHRKLEGEIDLMDGKIAKDEQRVFSGAISNPKELSALQANIEQEKRQKSTLEDELLEVMEQKEGVTETLTRLNAQRDELAAKVAELETKVAMLTGDIDADLGLHETMREKIAPEIPADLLALYEKLREQKGGVGAAAINAGTCEGCHTKLPAAEWEHVRSERGLQRCENCRRILVVTNP